MRLTEVEQAQARAQGALVSSKCDACGRVLNYLRYTIRDDHREFCNAAERDKCYYTQAELDKIIKNGSCLHCKGPKDIDNGPYCGTCVTVADPTGILTGKLKKSKETNGKHKEPGNPVRINRHTRDTKKANKGRRSVGDSPEIERTDCTTFHYTCRDLDAIVELSKGYMLICVNYIAIYNGYYQLDKSLAEYVYVYDAEEPEALKVA